MKKLSWYRLPEEQRIKLTFLEWVALVVIVAAYIFVILCARFSGYI